MAFYSQPGSVDFFTRILSWVKRQDERLWCMVPFWDSMGVAMINECPAKDIRIICRPKQVDKYLKKNVKVRYHQDLHTKLLIGDTTTLLGSLNMNYQSFFDNQENATYSRGESYAKFFLAEWKKLPPSIRG